MCLTPPMASSLNPTAQPWKPTEDQKPSLPSPKSQAVIKLPHELFPPPHILASPPPQMMMMIAFPPTMQHVNNHPFSPLYLLETASNYHCYSYDAQLQPKTFPFCPSLVTCSIYGCEKKRVAIEEVESHGGGEKGVSDDTTSPLTEVKAEKEVMVKEMKGLENLDYGDGEKVGLARRFMPPRLRKAKRRHSLGGYEKRIEMKQIWSPVNVKSVDSLVAGVGGSSSSPPLSPPTATLPSLPCGDDLLCENTTVMIKNVPNRFRRDTLMGFLDDCCRKYQLEYDFLYLPMDFRTHDNLGYAFVNFTTAAAAMKFKEVLQDYKWGPVYGPYGLSKSKKVCEITWAKIQGKDALVRHFENSQFICKTQDYLPMVLSPPRNGSNSTVQRIIGKLWSQSISPQRGIN